MFRVLLLSILFIFFISCVSTHKALQKVSHGATKQTVRNTLGKPHFVGRLDGKDYWTYKFRWNSQNYTRDVFFEAGRVYTISSLTPLSTYNKKKTIA